MKDGRFELWYGLIIMGIGIPVFVHYAMKWLRDSILRIQKGDLETVVSEDESRMNREWGRN